MRPLTHLILEQLLISLTRLMLGIYTFWQLLALRVFALDPSTVHHDNSQILNKHRKLQVQVRLWRGTYHSHDQGFFAHSTAGLMCFKVGSLLESYSL